MPIARKEPELIAPWALKDEAVKIEDQLAEAHAVSDRHFAVQAPNGLLVFKANQLQPDLVEALRVCDPSVQRRRPGPGERKLGAPNLIEDAYETYLVRLGVSNCLVADQHRLKDRARQFAAAAGIGNGHRPGTI